MPDKREVIDSRDIPSSPVFVDVTGRRRKRLRRLGHAAAALCGGYSIMIAVSLTGGPVSPRTLLPKVVAGDGETKAVPSAEQGAPNTGDGQGAFPRPLPRPSWPVRTPAAPGAAGSAPSGAASPGTVPSSPAPGNRRVRPRVPAGEPTPAPGNATPAPPTGSASPGTSPPAPGEPAKEEERSTGDEANGAAPQGAAAAPLGAGSSTPAPAGAQE